MLRVRSFLAAASVLALAAGCVVAPVDPGPQVYVRTAPPQPLVEPLLVAPPGQVWVPGHWQWSGSAYAWAPGRLVVARPGYYYANPTWRPHGDRWGFHGGGWVRGPRPYGDRDRDGVPNRYDRNRDGDGVPNRHDRRPNDPRRY